MFIECATVKRRALCCALSSYHVYIFWWKTKFTDIEAFLPFVCHFPPSPASSSCSFPARIWVLQYRGGEISIFVSHVRSLFLTTGLADPPSLLMLLGPGENHTKKTAGFGASGNEF